MRRALSAILFLPMLLTSLSAASAQVLIDTARQWQTPYAPSSSGFDWDWLITDPQRLLSLARQGDPQAQTYALWEDRVSLGDKVIWLDGLRAHRQDAAQRTVARIATNAFAAGSLPATELRLALVAAAAHDVSAAITLTTLDAGGDITGDMGNMGWLQGQIEAGNPTAAAAACRLAMAPDHLIANFFPACWTQADRGDAEAAWRVALALLARADDFNGPLVDGIETAFHVRRDPAAAMRFLKRAAAAGHAGATGRLAHLTAIGEGTARNDDEAARLAQGASERRNAEGMAVLGLLILQQRAEGDEEMALALLRRAAERGNRMAQYTLATLALRGRAVPRNFDEALMWLHLLRLDRRTDPSPERYGDLMLEPWPRTVVVGDSVRSPAADMAAIAKATQLRQRLEAEGLWPY